MIDTVTIDFWGTLLSDTPENMERAKALRLEGIGMVLARSGHRITSQGLTRAYEASGQAMARRWRENRDWTIREQVSVFLNSLSPDLAAQLDNDTLKLVEEAYTTPALSFPPALSPGVREAVTALHDAGLTLCVISNSGRTPGLILRKLLKRYDLLGRFTVVTFSDELGYRKPHPEIFQHTLERAGRELHRAVHIGDDAEADVGGAKGIGMRAVYYAPNGDPHPTSLTPDATLRHFAELPDVLQALDP